jgi:predicted component of type VI protein secretion system
MFSLSPASDMREYSGIIKEMQDHKETLICKSNALTELTNEKQDLLSNLERTQQELEQTKQKLTQSKNALSSQLKISCLREKELVALESKWRASMEHERKESEILRLRCLMIQRDQYLHRFSLIPRVFWQSTSAMGMRKEHESPHSTCTTFGMKEEKS